MLLDIAVLTEPASDTALLRLRGDVCVTTGPGLAEALESVVADGATHVVVDLTDVALCMSQGFDVLSTYHDLLAEAGGALDIVGAHGSVARSLDVLRTHDPSFLVGT